MDDFGATILMVIISRLADRRISVKQAWYYSLVKSLHCWSFYVMQKFTFKWNTHLYVSLFLSVCCSAHPSAPYLSNRTLCDHNFFYTCVKWWYLQGLFHFYEILIFWAVSGGVGEGGEEGKNSPKWKIKIISVAHNISGTILHMIIIFGRLV